MSTQHGQVTTVFPLGEARGMPASSDGPAAPSPAAPSPAAGNAIRFGPRTRRLIRAIARVVNPLVLRIAGRRHMPILGIVHHRGRKTGRTYATPLGVRPAVGGGFVMPLTFSVAHRHLIESRPDNPVIASRRWAVRASHRCPGHRRRGG